MFEMHLILTLYFFNLYWMAQIIFVLYNRGSQSSSGPASAGPHPPTGAAPFGMSANRSSAASLTEELRKTLESSYLDGGFSSGPPGSAGSQHKASSREKVSENMNILRIP